MKKSTWVTHVLFECRDCGKMFESYTNGQALAAKHAKVYKHFVSGEVGVCSHYDGRE